MVSSYLVTTFLQNYHGIHKGSKMFQKIWYTISTSGISTNSDGTLKYLSYGEPAFLRVGL